MKSALDEILDEYYRDEIREEAERLEVDILESFNEIVIQSEPNKIGILSPEY